MAAVRQKAVIAGAAGAVALCVYLATLAPSIVWGDSADLTTAAYLAGVPHPTGYPLYTLLAHPIARHLPLGTPAYRMNLLSALCAALAVGGFWLLVNRVTRFTAVATAGALLLAFSSTFWSQAVDAEVYAFHLLLTVATLLAVLRWDATGERRWLRLAAMIYGLSFTHHLMSVLLAPALLYLAGTSRRRRQFLRELPITLPLFLLPLLLYAYLPLAALRDPPANWGDPRTWDGFLSHVTGRQYRQFMFRQSPARLGEAALGFGGLLLRQFPAALALLAAPGLLFLWRRRRRLLGATVLFFVTDAVYGLNYRIHDVEVFYLPAILVLTLWSACGLAAILAGVTRRRKPLAPALAILMLAAPGATLAANWADNDRHSQWETISYARAQLDMLKPNAVVFGGGERWYLPLFYTRFVERRREDVVFVGLANLLFPERLRLTTRLRAQGLAAPVPDCYTDGSPGRHHQCLLRALVEANLGRRPVYFLPREEVLAYEWTSGVIRNHSPIAESNLPVIELLREQPRLGPPVAPRLRQPLAFSDSRGRTVLTLTGCEAARFETNGEEWLRLRYAWLVGDEEATRRVIVEALFADEQGSYERAENGEPRLHNFHRLGGGVDGPPAKLLREFGEEYRIHLGPESREGVLRLWLGVRLPDQPLSTDSGRRYVRVLEIGP